MFFSVWFTSSRMIISCCCSVIHSCLTLCNPMVCSMPDFPALHYLLELAQTHVHWVGDAIQPSHPLLFPSIRVFSNESVLHIRWLKYWSFSLSISLSNEYSGLISFRKGTGEPGGLLSMGSHRVGHDWSDLAAAGNLDPPMLCKWHYFILSLRLSSIPLYTYITSISIHLSGTFRLFTYPDFCK